MRTEADWKEIPTSPDTLERITADVLPEMATSEWSGDDLDRLRPHLLRVAARELSDNHFRMFVRLVGGESTVAIAEAENVAQSVVHRTLWGTKAAVPWENPTGIHGGVMARVRKALKQDEAFRAEAEKIQDEQQAANDDEDVTLWWAHLKTPPRPDLIPAFTVLFVASKIADARRRFYVQDIVARFPGHVTLALAPLKYGGWIRPVVEGVEYEILKTPLDRQEAAA